MNADRFAPWYLFCERLVFGRVLDRARLRFLADALGSRRVLILGDGDGRFTSEFVKRNSDAAVDSVELSRRMVELAKRRVPESVHFYIADARTIRLEGPYDLVITHFFLDCFSEPELTALIARISEQCAPRAKWLLSEFQIPKRGWARIVAGALIPFMYFFFRVVTNLKVRRLPDYRALLKRSGFELVKQSRALGGIVVSEIWQATRSAAKP